MQNHYLKFGVFAIFQSLDLAVVNSWGVRAGGNPPVREWGVGEDSFPTLKSNRLAIDVNSFVEIRESELDSQLHQFRQVVLSVVA